PRINQFAVFQPILHDDRTDVIAILHDIEPFGVFALSGESYVDLDGLTIVECHDVQGWYPYTHRLRIADHRTDAVGDYLARIDWREPVGMTQRDISDATGFDAGDLYESADRCARSSISKRWRGPRASPRRR